MIIQQFGFASGVSVSLLQQFLTILQHLLISSVSDLSLQQSAPSWFLSVQQFTIIQQLGFAPGVSAFFSSLLQQFLIILQHVLLASLSDLLQQLAPIFLSPVQQFTIIQHLGCVPVVSVSFSRLLQQFVTILQHFLVFAMPGLLLQQSSSTLLLSVQQLTTIQQLGLGPAVSVAFP